MKINLIINTNFMDTELQLDEVITVRNLTQSLRITNKIAIPIDPIHITFREGLVYSSLERKHRPRENADIELHKLKWRGTD